MPKTRPQFAGYDRQDLFAKLKRDGGVLALGNTFPAMPDWLQREALSQIEACFAPLKAFTTVLDPNPFQPKSNNVVKYISSTSPTIVDGTSFQVGDANTITGLPVSVSHFCQPWPVSAKDLQSGVRQADLLFANVQALSETIAGVIGLLFSTGSFPAAPIITTAAAFGLSDAAQIYGRLPGPNKSLILDPTRFGMISHASPKAFASGQAAHGWRGIHELSSGWAGKVKGIGCVPTAIIAVCGNLVDWNATNLVRRLFGLPGLDLTIEWNCWFDQPTRTTWNSLDCIFGAAVGQSTGGIVILDN